MVPLFFLFLLPAHAAVNSLKENPLYHVGNRTLTTDGKPVLYKDPYLDQIQPLLAARCVACHGCFEAPCQLNLQSYEGLRRGFHPEPIYSKKRLTNSYPTRMIDAQSLAEWRTKKFLPVVDSIGIEPEREANDFESSVMYRLLVLGEKRDPAGFNVNALRNLQNWIDENSRGVCVASEKQFDAHFKAKGQNRWNVVPLSQYETNWPSAGMPFGLPVSPEHDELKAWVAAGSVGPSVNAQKALGTPANPEEIQRWEDFLNDRSNKGLHVGRYIYEHVYTAHILFKNNPGEFFTLVRSRTKLGKIDQIVKELPYDAPGAEVFYRFKKITHSIVHKTHFTWELDDTKRTHLKMLFFDEWTTHDHLVPAPTYLTKAGYTNPNPFEYFEPIPARSRARFMIENSRIIVAAMTQGSVCVGTGATFAINDHFWAWFLKPESDVSVISPRLGQENWDNFATANIDGENPIAHFARTAKAHAKYEEAYEVALREWLKARNGAKGLSINDLWTGEGDPSYPKGNPNAWLNITRHDKSATVQFGTEGGAPHSIWILSYSNFERLYYNLVASFREWGSADHKAATWRHMSYVRIEGEDLAISLLPITFRSDVRKRFARGISYWRNKPYPQYSVIGLDNLKHLTHFLHRKDLPPRIAGTPNPGKTADEAISYLVKEVKKKWVTEIPDPATIKVSAERQDFERQLNWYQDKSRELPGISYARAFTHVAYLRVEGDSDNEPWIYSLIGNRAYEGHNDVLIQKRTPQFDTFSVYRGFIGGYPNVILTVSKANRRAFIEDIAKLGTTELTWDTFRGRWGLARNIGKFWDLFDELHRIKAIGQLGVIPSEQGIADLSQYEIFEKPETTPPFP